MNSLANSLSLPIEQVSGVAAELPNPDPAAVRKAVGQAQPNLSPGMEQALMESFTAWRDRGGGERLRATLEEKGLEGWREAIAEVLRSPEFQRLQGHVDEHNLKARREVQLSVIKSTIVQTTVEIDLGFSGEVSLVFATGTDDWTYTTVSVSAAAGFGAKAGASLSQSFGFSGADPGEAGGCAIGVQAEVEDSVGMCIEASVAVNVLPSSFKDLLLLGLGDILPEVNVSQWTITAGGGLGIDDGVGVFAEVGFIIADKILPPVAQPDGKHMARIFEVRCDEVAATSNWAKDEIYLEFTPDTGTTTYRYPPTGHFSIGISGDDERVWRCARSVKFNHSFTLAIKDDGDTLAKWTITYPFDTIRNKDGFEYNYKSDKTKGLFNEIAYRVKVTSLY